MKAYLDIETSFNNDITVIGIFRSDKGTIQLVDGAVTPSNIFWMLDGVSTVYTYNGSRFDLPVIRRILDVDINRHFHCRDLMYDCWKKNLYGGLKKVEKTLGIQRLTKGVDGMEAMLLWQRYKTRNDESALETLLLYNREDVLTLPLIEDCLHFSGTRTKIAHEVPVEILR